MSPGDHQGATVDVPGDGRLDGWHTSLDPAKPNIAVIQLHTACKPVEGRWP